MKPFSLLAALQFAIAPFVFAQNVSFIAQEISLISPCGISCLVDTVPAARCSLTNITCQCSSTRLVRTTAACMMTNCTLAEALELSQIQAAICQRPFESQRRKIRIMTIVCAIITNTAVLVRFSTRLGLHQRFGVDDWFIAATIVTDVLFTYFAVQLEHDGFGEHVWNIKLDDVPHLFYWFYICEMLYVLTIGLVKGSMLFFYLRVFPKPSFRVACWATIAFCSASTVAFTLVTVFQCHPISFVWRKDLKGKCINYNSVAWTNAGINIVQDIIIILLPMRELRRLQLSRKKKIWMYAMFGVGGFVCLTAMVRLESLRTFGLTADPTWDNVPTTFWSTLESTTAIFCACMPTFRAGFARISQRAMELTSIHHPSSSAKLSEHVTENGPFSPHLSKMSTKITSYYIENDSISSLIPQDKPELDGIPMLPFHTRTNLNQVSKTEGNMVTDSVRSIRLQGTAIDSALRKPPSSVPKSKHSRSKSVLTSTSTILSGTGTEGEEIGYTVRITAGNT